MPEIVFKGKEYVYNHHLTVPYRPQVADQSKGIGPGGFHAASVCVVPTELNHEPTTATLHTGTGAF